MPDKLISLEDAAEVLDVSVAWVRGLINTGRIRNAGTSEHPALRADDVDTYLAEKENGAGSYRRPESEHRTGKSWEPEDDSEE